MSDLVQELSLSPLPTSRNLSKLCRETELRSPYSSKCGAYYCYLFLRVPLLRRLISNSSSAISVTSSHARQRSREASHPSARAPSLASSATCRLLLRNSPPLRASSCLGAIQTLAPSARPRLSQRNTPSTLQSSLNGTAATLTRSMLLSRSARISRLQQQVC